MDFVRVILLSFFLIFMLHSSNSIVNVISDFLRSLKIPVKVTSFLCWDPKYLIFFIKRVNYISIQVSVNYVSSVEKEVPFIKTSEHQIYIIDLDCEFAENVLQSAYNMSLLNPPFRWIILRSCNNDHNFSQYDIFLNSRIYTIDKCTKGRNRYEINSIYKHTKTKNIVTHDVGVWDNGIEYLKPISDIGNRSNQMGLDVNITLVLRFKESLNDLVEVRNRKRDVNSKHNNMLARCIVDVLNVTPHYIYRPTWGVPDKKTGRFDGLVGDLIYGTSQLAASPLYILKDRLPYMDFLSHTAPTQGSFVFRAPPLSSVSNIFRLPFNSNVWLACAVTLLLIFLVLCCLIPWEWYVETYQESLGETESEVTKLTLLDAIQMEIGAVCQQGTELEPKSVAARVGIFFIFLSLMFIYTAYSANIVALLQSTTENIKTLEDLYNSKVEFGVFNISYNLYHLKRLRDPIQKLVVDNVLPNGLISLDDGVKRMRSSFYALFGETDAIYIRIIDTFEEHEKCDLMQVPFWSINHPWIPIRKNSTFKEIVKIAYCKLDERGVRDRIYKKLHATKPRCENQGANFTSVSINDCYFALLIFVVGFILSLLILIMEIVIHRTKVVAKLKFKFKTMSSFNSRNKK